MKRTLLFIPMYNCEKQITRVLDQITPEVATLLSEVIVVNNRSTDNGEEVVKNYLETWQHAIPVSLLRNDQNYGLGGSHKVAFNYALEHGFDYVVVLHGDDQGNIQDVVPLLLSSEHEKYDCLLGARFQKGSKIEGYSKFRTFGNKVYNLLFSLVVKTMVKDLGSGLNMYSAKMLESKFYIPFADDLTFNYYMVLANSYYKFKIKFFPISWREDDQVSNVKLFSQAKRTLKVLWSYFVGKKKFMEADHRANKEFVYTSTLVASRNK